MSLEIEVSERGGAPGKPSYYAQLKGDPKILACGNTPNEAIGDLVYSHQKVFGVTITSFVKPKA